MQLLRGINQVLYFLIELSMLAALGYAGFQHAHPIGRYTWGIGLPLVAAILWGFFAAPRSSYRLVSPYRSFFALALFGLAFYLFYRAGQPRLAIVLGSMALISELAGLLLKQ